MNRNYDCPNCGAAVEFQSSITVFAVCSHCGSMVVRRDVAVESIGQMAALPPDLSPLQLGTRGEFEGQAFTLIGRVRLAYDEGSWNEWFATFGDGRHGWVAEAQGFFMVSFDTQPPPDFPAGPNMGAGYTAQIEGQSYMATDRKENVCLGSEGELTIAAAPGRKATTVDFTGPGGGFASAEFSDEGVRLFTGRYAEFNDLKFTNLRAVPGWSEEALEPERHQTTALNCPNCGAVVELRAAGFTMSATCGSCGSLIDTAMPELRLISTAEQRQRFKPLIPLGKRGVLFGVNFEVIGFQRTGDPYSHWFEYLLFNPWQGFAWLVTYEGHWSFVRRLLEVPEVATGVFQKTESAKFRGETYHIFAKSQVKTDYVAGEFYWKVSVGMPVEATDFIRPPRILSREGYPELKEVTWSQGEYIDSEIVEKAFNPETPLREPAGIYLNQPNRFADKFAQLKWIAPTFAVLLVLIQLVSATRAAHKRVLSAAFMYQSGQSNPPVMTQPFEITGGNQALDLTLEAPVDNKWIEVGIDLVNADTHQAVGSFEQGVEYYHGYDDGPWSEGRQAEHRLIPAVSPGRYYLVLEPSADTGVTQMPYSVTVERDVLAWSNFWIALGLISAYPLYCGFRSWRFESARWAESDYSPAMYLTKTSDDD